LDANCTSPSLAAVRVFNGEIVDQFCTLVRCERPISTGASAVHGDTDGDLAGKPSLAEVWPSFRTFVGDSVMVAHNGHQFDVPVLKRLTEAFDGLAGVTFYDSLPLARHLFPTGGLRLEDLAVRFGIETGRSHHALDDAICLGRVFERLQEMRIQRATATALANLLDFVGVGMAIEDVSELAHDAKAVFALGRRRALGSFSSLIECYDKEAQDSGRMCAPVPEVIDRLGGLELRQRLQKKPNPQDRYPESYARLRHLIEMHESDNLDESVQRLLDCIALSRSDGARIDPDRVCLLTFHATKGLEFSRVYVIGVEDYKLPGFHQICENLEDEIAEARRVLYVAMTRAKDRLCLTYCREREGRPSGGTMFLSEMDLAVSDGRAIVH
jgi:DNA polymerase III epsilon subunit-like protein